MKWIAFVLLGTMLHTGYAQRIFPVSETALLRSFQNPHITIAVIPKLNHYLTDREATSGTSLYQMDKEALNTIMDWTLTLSD